MPKSFIVNRRSLLLGTSALGVTGLLAACGGGKGGNTTNAESASALGVGEDIAKLVSINPKKREELKEGGQLTLPLQDLGPDFSPVNNNGNSSENLTAVNTVHFSALNGCWKSDIEGKATVNPDFCESFETKMEGGKQVHRIKLNPKAKFNDGTPIDIESLKVTHEVLSGKNKEYNIVNAGAYEFIDTIEQDGEAIKVTMVSPYYPVDALYGRLLHPAFKDVETFNNGFVDNLHPEWAAGPFTVEEWSSSEKRLTVKRNDNWWGEKPVLEKVIFRQMEPSAARAAFKNGEVDSVGARTLTAYKDVEGTADTEVRRGQRLFAGGLNMASGRLPVEIRKAVMASVDRKALAEIRFNGLNWSEEIPGSMMLMPFSEYYRDNFSEAKKEWGDAAKILEGAGYKKDGDFYKKNGKNAKFSVTTFGDDPVSSALSQTLVQQMKSAGIECVIDNKPDAEFAKVMGNNEYDFTFSGYSVGSDATSVASQYYLHANAGENLGNDKIDKMIKDMQVTEDTKERNAKCNDIELVHLKEYAMMAPFFNGPDIMVVKNGLANFGPSLFDTTDWSLIGWVK